VAVRRIFDSAKDLWSKAVLCFLLLGVSVMLTFFAVSCARGGNQVAGHGKKAVILDTDIGDDIDDTWALVTLLNSPELDVKLITTAVGDTELKAKLVAKVLQTAGRTDIPIGIGVPVGKTPCPQQAWLKDFDMSAYKGTVYKDGVGALIETVMKGDEPVTIIAIGPLPNIAAALEREPAIAKKAKYIGMQGSIYKGYNGEDKPAAEYNVKQSPKEAQRVFEAQWDKTITPLDTCGIVHLDGEKYQKVYESDATLAKALMEAYKMWLTKVDWLDRNTVDVSKASTILFDTVAVYLAVSRDLIQMEKLPVRVTDTGYTQVDDSGKIVNCATEWKDLPGYEDWLVGRLTR
jgi:inosine-uridine nucleoside N-ribohydrolase